jgi:hypothetical protein
MSILIVASSNSGIVSGTTDISRGLRTYSANLGGDWWPLTSIRPCLRAKTDPKIVILEFPDEVAALEFHNSAEYQEISIDRKAGADARSSAVFRERTHDLSHPGPCYP